MRLWVLTSEATKKKSRRGRKPIEVTPALCSKAEKLAARGLTEKQIAMCLGFSQVTLIKKKKEFIEFLQAIKKGQAIAIAAIEKALFDSAREPGNIEAKIFFLKNRNPECWNERFHVEHKVEGLAELIKAARARGADLENS